MENKNAEEATIHLIDYAKLKCVNIAKKKKKNSETNDSIYKENYNDITCVVLFLDH